MEVPAPLRVLVVGALLGGCGGDGDPKDLVVDVRTDVRPGYEFEAVRVELVGVEAVGSGRVERLASDDEAMAYLEGHRVAQFEDLSRSQATVRVSLLDSRGLPVLERAASVRIGTSDRVVTVVLTRDCAAVRCPGEGDDPSLIACLGGRCVDPRCTPESPEHCPTGCTDDSECAVEASCATGRCDHATCFRVEREGACETTEWCHPEVGCAARPVDMDAATSVDAGMDGAAQPDGGMDAAVATDSGMDAMGAPDVGVGSDGCTGDCRAAECGDGTCNASENGCNCPSDCGAGSCGDGLCCTSAGETTCGCAADCGATACGDGCCGGSETTCSCSADCGTSCGDGCCNGGEDTTSCVPDCGSSCGDGTCNGTEDGCTCAADCSGMSCPDTRCGDLHAGAIFCDGFEVAALSGWDGTYETDGFVERRTDIAYLGDGSLYSQVDVASGRAAAVELITAITTGHVYLRAHVYLPSTVSLNGGFGVMEVGENTSPYHHSSFSVKDGHTELFSVGAGGTWSLDMGSPFPVDVWTCVELHVELSSTSGVAELFVNDTLEATISGMPTTPAAGFQRIVVGSTYVPSDQPSTIVRIDEVVLDDQRIYCD